MCLSTCAHPAVQGGGHTRGGRRSGVRVLQHTVAALGAGAVPLRVGTHPWPCGCLGAHGSGVHSPQQQLLVHTHGEVITQTWAGTARGVAGKEG